MKCLKCGNETSNKKFCNNKCQGLYTIYKLVTIGKAKQRTLRKYLLLTEGHRCKICNGENWQNQKIPLVLDHIDGNSDNDDLQNLRLICCNCDALLPTYKSKNRNSARKYRMQRYYAGKTY